MPTLADNFNLEEVLEELCIETDKLALYRAKMYEAFSFIEQQTCIPNLFDLPNDEEICLTYNHNDGHVWERNCGSFPTVYSIGMWRKIEKMDWRPLPIGLDRTIPTESWYPFDNNGLVMEYANFNTRTGVIYTRPIIELARPPEECCSCGCFPKCYEIRVCGYYGFEKVPEEFKAVVYDFLLEAREQDSSFSGGGSSSSSTDGQVVETYLKRKSTQTKTVEYENVVLDGPSQSQSQYNYNYNRLSNDQRKSLLKKYSICRCYSM